VTSWVFSSRYGTFPPFFSLRTVFSNSWSLVFVGFFFPLWDFPTSLLFLDRLLYSVSTAFGGFFFPLWDFPTLLISSVRFLYSWVFSYSGFPTSVFWLLALCLATLYTWVFLPFGVSHFSFSAISFLLSCFSPFTQSSHDAWSGGLSGVFHGSPPRPPTGSSPPRGRLCVCSFLSLSLGFVLPFVTGSLVRSRLGLLGALACLVAAWVNFVDLRLVPGLSVIQPRPPLRGPGQRQSTRDKRSECTLNLARTEMQGDGRAIPQKDRPEQPRKRRG
jgi:hypothetical protein